MGGTRGYAAGLFRGRAGRGETGRESGYALLLVFLIAGLIALTLYQELPRVVFESQRAREELLIERGEQYKRAIQLFVRKAGRYPASIEELESLNNVRFLRRRYRDPMTGKDKWRLIHVNGGVLTDSIIPKNRPGPDQRPLADTNTFIGEGPVMGGAAEAAQQPVNPAMKRRASDDRPVVTEEVADPPAPADADQANTASQGIDATEANAHAQMTPSQPTPATQPTQASGQSTDPTPGSFMYVAPSLGQASGSSVYVAPALGQTSAATGQVIADRRLHGDFQSGGSSGPPPDAASPQQPASPPPASLSGGPSAAAGAVSASIASPNPNIGAQMGGGIAGVASESSEPAIKVYNERKKYSEWEFVYDQSKDRSLAGVQRNGGSPGSPAPSQPVANQPGSSGVPSN